MGEVGVKIRVEEYAAVLQNIEWPS